MLTIKGANVAIDATTGQATQIGLFNSEEIDEEEILTEVNAGGYARQPIAFNPAEGGKATNTADIFFLEATASWGEITHIGLFNADNDEIWRGPLSSAKTIDKDDQFKIGAGRLTVEIK